MISPIIGADIFHTKPKELSPNQPLDILVELGRDLENSSVSVFFKLANEPLFSEETLAPIGGNAFQSLLTPVINGESQLLYYIQVRKKNGDIITFPEFNPEETPIIVPIEQSLVEKPSIEIINPEDNSISPESEPTILIGFEDSFDQFNYQTFEFKINDKNLTKRVFLSPPFGTYIPTRKLTEGNHNIGVKILDKKGQVYTDSILYTYQRFKPKLFTVTGSLNWQQSFFNTDKISTVETREAYESRLSTIVNINSKQFKSKLTSLLDNRHSSSKQPLNRLKYTIFDNKKNAHLTLGDASPKFSTYTFNGRRVGGFDINLDTLRWLGLKRALTLKVASGETKKIIPIQTGITAGTYKQEMTGIQLGLNLGKLKHNLNYVKITDDKTSLTDAERGTSKPQENHVISFATDYKFFDQTRLQFELAGAAYYSDSTAPERDVNDLDLNISKSTLEEVSNILPLRSSITLGYASNLKLISPIIGRKLIFKLDSEWVHPNFTSLGNTGLRKDNFNYSLGLNSRLLNNRLSFSGNYQSQRNNVTESDDATTFSDTYRLNSSYNWVNVGLLNLGYSIKNTKNKIKPTSTVANIENDLQSLSLGLGNINIITGDITHILNTSLSLSSFNDKITKSNNFDSTVMGLNTATKMDKLKLSFGVNRSVRDAKTVTPNSTISMAYSSKITYTVIPKLFTAYSGLKLSNSLNNGDDISQHLDTKKIVFTIGGNISLKKYKLFTNSKIRFNLDFSESKDNKDKTDRSKNFSDTFFTVNVSTRF